MIPPGLKLETRKILDFDFKTAFPEVKVPEFPIGRQNEAKGLKVLYQGSEATCVPCSVLWIGNWFSRATNSSIEQLSTGLDSRGTFPSKVLDTAYKLGVIPNYLYLRNPNDMTELKKALSVSPLIIGLWNWPLVPGGHAMVLLDILEDSFLCVNWANKDHTDFVTLPLETTFEFAVAFSELHFPARLPIWSSLYHKFISLISIVCR